MNWKKFRNCVFCMCITAVLSGQMISGSAVLAEEKNIYNIEETLLDMTIQEKVAQMFFITPEQLTEYERVIRAGEVTKSAYEKYPVGGLIYFENNLESEDQTKKMLNDMEEISLGCIGIPVFLGVDEEGGRVTRLYKSNISDIPEVKSMLELGENGDAEEIYRTGKILGSYLSDFGFNLNFAPVADVYSNPQNQIIGDRAFGKDADTVSRAVSEMVKGMEGLGVRTVLKHFPGHGDTIQDSHLELAVSDKSLEELYKCEFLPFRAGIEAGSEIVMIGHINLSSVLKEKIPATFSEQVIQEILRNEMGFGGVVITDAMNMRAITDQYESGEAAIMAIRAGADMILMPEDFKEAYRAVLTAVESGVLTTERIDESVSRILKVKMNKL